MCMTPAAFSEAPVLTPTSAKLVFTHAGAIAGEGTRSASTSPAAADAGVISGEALAPLPPPPAEVDDCEGRRAAAAVQLHTAPPRQRQRSSSEGSESSSRTQVVYLY
jgi:hypothetical protein